MAFADFYSSELPDNVQLAFQTLYAQLRAFVGVSFNEDGTLIPAAPNVGISPIGSIQMYGGATAPSKWLLCDGTAVSRVTYKDLFSVIGTSYGTGDGSTTFALPDLRQRFPLGKAASGTGATLGDHGGAIDHVHSGPSHTHTSGAVSGSTGSTAPGTDSQGAHTHTFTTGQAIADTTVNVAGGADAVVETKFHEHAGTTDSGGAHSHTVNSHSHAVGSLAVADTGAAGSGNTGTANPPFVAVNFIVLAGV